MSFQTELKETIKEIAGDESQLRQKDSEYHNKTNLHVKVSKDITHIDDYVAAFSKALPHDTNGFVNHHQMKLLLKALKTGERKYIDKIIMGNPNGMKLVNLMAFTSTELFGINAASYEILDAPEFKSAQFAGEEVEVYEMYLNRDVNFQDFGTNSSIADAVTSLNLLSDYRGIKPVTTANIFRGISTGDLVGPYVSQFLYLPFKYGVMDMVQQYALPQVGSDYLKTISDYLLDQNGTVPSPALSMDPTKRYINTMRDLSEFVHNDSMCQAFFNAHLIIQGLKVPYNIGHPYRAMIKNEAPFITMGPPDIQDLIHRVSKSALLSGWVRKISYMRIRPEAYAFEVNRAKNGLNFGVHNDVLNSPTLTRVYIKSGNTNYLLPTSYAEGSPAHPAYPSGHACIAGAATTILKAFYDGTFVFTQAYLANGSVLNTIPDQLNLNDELNKLASNIAYGRNMSGIHYRSDAEEGIKLGEKIAIKLLREHVHRYEEKVAFQLTKRNGKKIVITN